MAGIVLIIFFNSFNDSPSLHHGHTENELEAKLVGV